MFAGPVFFMCFNIEGIFGNFEHAKCQQQGILLFILFY